MEMINVQTFIDNRSAELGSVDNCPQSPTWRGLSAPSIDPADKPRDMGSRMNCQHLPEDIAAAKKTQIDSTINIVEQHRQEDIVLFKRIQNSIHHIINESPSTKKTIPDNLKVIASSSKEIHRNGKRHGKENYLRNKYGLNDYVTDMIRPGGINFDLLSHLDQLPEQILMPEYDSVLSEIKCLLKVINEKLDLALQVETEPHNVNYSNVVDSFKTRESPEILLRKALTLEAGKKYFSHILEISNDELLKNLDLTKKEDRYYLGMQLSILGEISKKIEIIIGRDEGILRFFKLIRNETAHNIKFMIEKLTADQINICKLLLTEFKRDLKNVAETALSRIKAVVSQDELNKFDISFGIYEETQRSVFNKILETLVGKEKAPLTANAFTLFSSSIDFTKRKDAHVKETNSLKGIIASLKRLINKGERCPDRFTDLDQQQGIAFATLINKTIKKMPNPQFPFSHPQFPFFDESNFPTPKQLESVGAYITKNPRLNNATIDEPDVNHEKEFRTKKEPTQKKNIVKEEKDLKTKQNLLAEKYKFIEEELDYILKVVGNKDLPELKKELVIKFSVAKIGQVYRDINESDLDQSITNIQSMMHKKSTRIAVDTRNGIMHKVFEADFNTSFTINLFRHILPLLSDVKALSKIMETITEDTRIGDARKGIAHILPFVLAYRDLSEYERAINLLKELLIVNGIGKQEENITAIIENWKSDFKNAKKTTDSSQLDITYEVYNCFYMIALNFGLWGEKLKQENAEAARVMNTYRTKITILEILLELKQNLPDRARIALIGSIGSAYSNIGQHEKAFDCNLRAYQLVNKTHGLTDKDVALYLTNLAIASYYHFWPNLEKEVLANQHDIESTSYQIRLSRSLLWWARELCHKADIPRNSDRYICILVPLVKYTQLIGDRDLASELFVECEASLSITPLKEDHILVRRFQELKKFMEDTSKSRSSVTSTTNKDKAILTFNSLIELDVFFYNQKTTVDIMNQLIASKAVLDKHRLSVDERNTINISFTNYEAVCLFRNGQYKESIQKFLELTAQDNTKSEIYESLGDAFSKFDNPSSAIRNFLVAFNLYARDQASQRTFLLPIKILQEDRKLPVNSGSNVPISTEQLSLMEQSYLHLKSKVGSSNDKDMLIHTEFCLLYLYNKHENNNKVAEYLSLCQQRLKSKNDLASIYHELLRGISEQHNKRTLPSGSQKDPSEFKLKAEQTNQAGVQHYKNNQFKQAMTCFNSGLTNNLSFFGENLHLDIATSYWNLSSCYLKEGANDQALLHVKEAYRIRFILLGEAHELTKKTKLRLDECNNNCNMPSRNLKVC